MVMEEFKRQKLRIYGENLQVIAEYEGGILTTYDPRTDTFGNATTVVGGPFQPSVFEPMSVDAAIEMMRDARRRHGLT